MVCLCVVGGGLIVDPKHQDRLEEAARHHANNDIADAVAIYRDILNQTPDQPDALLMMGVIAQQAGNAELALQFIESALAAKPDFAQAWFNRSVILRALKRDDDALQSARMAAVAEPNLAPAWDMIGQILKDRGAYGEASASHNRALTLQPDNALFYGNYAALLYVMGDLCAAYLAAQRASVLDKNWPPLMLGNILKAMGYPEQAAACFARARELRPDYAEAAASEAMAHLQMGDSETGWKLWEQRPDLAPELAHIPFWQGQKIDTLLLYEDQGLGDAIQFLRYIPLLKKLATHIVFRTHSSLRRLCTENFPDIEVIEIENNLPSVAARCRLSSLPFFFGTALDSIPAVPYLKTAQKIEVIKNIDSPRIGLVWAGNKKFHNDNIRSIKFSDLRPLIATGATHFVSLQKDRLEDVASGIFDAAPLLHDFSDTAALISALDLVITVDTAVAHLAGALGKPVFILLPFDSDWRWLLGRRDSPWYKTARLFRQQKPGDWATVIQLLTKEIEKFLTGDKSVLQPPVWQGECLRKNPDALEFPG